MAKFITKVKPGDMIEHNGKKQVVISVHKYVARLLDTETQLMSAISIGDLVIAGIESPEATLPEYFPK